MGSIMIIINKTKDYIEYWVQNHMKIEQNTIEIFLFVIEIDSKNFLKVLKIKKTLKINWFKMALTPFKIEFYNGKSIYDS
jgi:hypothetical protein